MKLWGQTILDLQAHLRLRLEMATWKITLGLLYKRCFVSEFDLTVTSDTLSFNYVFGSMNIWNG